MDDATTEPGPDPDAEGTLIEPEGVNAGSGTATGEDEPAPADVEGGGDLTEEPPARGDGASDQEPGLLGSSEADGQDEGSID